MKDLPRIVTPRMGRFCPQFSRPFLDEMMFAGDPLADAAILALKESAYGDQSGKLEAVRVLANQGDPAARAFLEQAFDRPDWVNDALLARGQKTALAFYRQYRLSLMHSLISGAVFIRAAFVTLSTGRMTGDMMRRMRETSAFVGAILRSKHLAPDSIGVASAVRVRLLHASIRLWLKRSPGFSDRYTGEPIDQTMLAMTLGLFSYLNARTLARLGIWLSDEDLYAHRHFWRYIGWLMGIDERLLPKEPEQERRLWSALIAHQAFPECFDLSYLEWIADALSQMKEEPREREKFRKFLIAFFLYLSGPEWFGVSKTDLPHGMDGRLPLMVAGGAAAALISKAPLVQDFFARSGADYWSNAEKLAQSHDFGARFQTSAAESARTLKQLDDFSQAMRRRFDFSQQGA